MRILFYLMLLASAVSAQVSVTNLAEYQLGNLPYAEPGNLSTLFNQTTIEYRQNPITVGLRLENFQSSLEERSYSTVAQRYVTWRSRRIKIRLGNFNTTLGRGLIMRSFELPGVVFEQRQFRRRYAYYRDVDGLLAQGTWKRFEFTLLHGKPLNETVPPGFDESRRSGLVQGGQVKLRPTSWLMAGDAYVRAQVPHSANGNNEINSLFSEINFAKLLRKGGLEQSSMKIYAEHARSNTQVRDFFSNKNGDGHATYVNVVFGYKRFGLSAEYKDYENFENGLNVPPIGYMEHGYYLLNRSTHELLADNESGWQLEGTWRLNEKIFLLANASAALNDFPGSRFEFSEKMFEATITASDRIDGKLFYNRSKDELRGELKRVTGGVNLVWQMTPIYSLTADVQHQSVDRGFGSVISEELQNTYAAITFSAAPKVSLSLVVQRSTDSAETDDPATFDVTETTPKIWLALSGAYQLDMNHELIFFYGTRRGGLACTSGTCYEVLPFEGFELRWTAHLP